MRIRIQRRQASLDPLGGGKGNHGAVVGAQFQGREIGARLERLERRVQLGLPVGSFWGNAATWAMYARAAGYRVDNTPSVGAIAQWNAYQGGSYYAGHVGIVESVNSDGSITISEMNYLYNFNRVTSRTISPSSVSNFIH